MGCNTPAATQPRSMVCIQGCRRIHPKYLPYPQDQPSGGNTLSQRWIRPTTSCYITTASPPTATYLHEVRIAQCGGPKRTLIDFNPTDDREDEFTLWLWGADWIHYLEWDPKKWMWRRIKILAETSVLNCTIKRGCRVALQQDNHTMKVDAELTVASFNNKTREKNFNRIWHPYLPRKVSAMQWLILTAGLPVGAWGEHTCLLSDCQLCSAQEKETLQHAFFDCP